MKCIQQLLFSNVQTNKTLGIQCFEILVSTDAGPNQQTAQTEQTEAALWWSQYRSS